ncbi:MAG TPA: ornithine cyclodeaminase [Paludibacteraceae bacterium]|nr:ornithine cyclodeaminase [Paludibacteraceae bacterium]
MKIISEQQIRSLGITPKQCVEWIYESFSLKSRAQLPAKISVHPTDMNFFTSMPCLLPPPVHPNDIQYFGIKEVHRIEGNVPSLGSDMMLYNAKRGELLALVDCDWITTMRTGAVAAVSIKALKKNSAETYGFVGLGNTARATLLCMLDNEPERFFHIKLLRYKNHAEIFSERFKEYKNVEFEVVDDINLLANSVDVFVSCITSANGLLVENEQSFRPGVTVIPVHMRGLQNCDTTFDRVFGDDTDHVKDFKYFHLFKNYNEIGEVLAGRDPGRISDDQRIIDYNYGLGLHDVLFASKIYEMIFDKPCMEVELIKETQKYWI